MASADLRKELDCSICLNIYRDPITLRCGHNFCRDCINRVLDTQEGAGVYFCPECRAECQERPVLVKNITLCNIAESFQSTRPDLEETGIFCTYCVDSPVPAAKSCLMCEASLCDKHLQVHSKSADHILSDPIPSPGNRLCSVHRKMLDFYCNKESVCICAHCCVTGEHRGHQVEMLEQALEKRKEKLRGDLQKLTTKRAEAEQRIHSLQEHKREVQEKAAGFTERVGALVLDIRKQLEDLECRVLSDISRQEEKVLTSVSEQIKRLEIKKDELFMKMCHIEELCHISDAVTVLQEPDIGDMCDIGEEVCYKPLPNTGNLDPSVISGTLQTLSELITDINIGIYAMGIADIHLYINTASNNVIIFDDIKTASRSLQIQNYPGTAERFKEYPQVLSTKKFSFGQHCWDVEFRNSESWRIGMCYPSIMRSGDQSCIGENDKSWALMWCNSQYSVIHNQEEIPLLDKIPCSKMRICLNYEAGSLSFISLSDPIRLLHKVKATFSEPLHIALAVWEGSMQVSRGVKNWQ